MNRIHVFALATVTFCFVNSGTAVADEADAKSAKPVPLNKQGTLLLDKPNGRLLLKTEVALREGVLEMFVCRKETKEHESILSFDGRAWDVHVGLIALGAKSGSPVQFVPKFRPPRGTKIAMFVSWEDAKGKTQRVSADKWVRHVTRRYFVQKLADGLPAEVKLPEDGEMRYDQKHRELIWYGIMTAAERDALLKLSADKAYTKVVKTIFDRSQLRAMEADFVFAGSSFYVDEAGKKHYQAESGDLVCVANFATATIDIAAKSSASGEENLLYETWTERIPPLGTKVTLELVPQLKKPDDGDADGNEGAKD